MPRSEKHLQADTDFWYTGDMGANTSITLSDHFTDFAAEQVRSGRYASVSEVVRAGLRLLEEDQARLDRLRAALQEGIDSGPAVPFDMDAWIDENYPSE